MSFAAARSGVLLGALLAGFSACTAPDDTSIAEGMAHVSDEFRACALADWDTSTWPDWRLDHPPPGFDVEVEVDPLVEIVTDADGGRWVATAQLSFWFTERTADSTNESHIGEAVELSRQEFRAAGFRELCRVASGRDWVDRARKRVEALFEPTPVFVEHRSLRLRRLG